MSDLSLFQLSRTYVPTQEVLFLAPPPADVSCTHHTLKHTIPDEALDPDAVKVVRRLSRFGYDAFLVGGCVRDILFGKHPKDFDVVTSALPSEIRRIFRNCRLIGKRFRLAHLLFKNGKIIEVATFRRSATSEDDITTRHAAENLFGGPADDAVRRDFTINALMYDVGKRQIHDYVGGLADIEARALSTIGDPDRRFTEDPVRIIRAVKFSKRLNLSISPQLMDSMKRNAHLVRDCAPARLVEELFKVLRTGEAAASMRLLSDVGVMKHLMPLLSEEAFRAKDRNANWRFLKGLDSKIRRGSLVSEATMLAALIYPFSISLLDESKGGDLAAMMHERVSTLLSPMRFPKKHVAYVRQILVAQRGLRGGPSTKRARRILERDYASHALDLMIISAGDSATKRLHAEWLDLFTKTHARKMHRRTAR